MKEVADKQKEARNANKSHAFTGRTTITQAGLTELEREKARQAREKGKENDDDRDSMDVDEPAEGSKGKGRK